MFYWFFYFWRRGPVRYKFLCLFELENVAVVNMTSAEGVCNIDYNYYCHFYLNTPLMVTGIKIVLITSCLTVTLMLESYGALIIYYVIMPSFAQNIDFFCMIYFFGGSWTCYLYSTYFICTNLLQAVTINFCLSWKERKKVCHANSHWRELGVLRNK